MGAKMEGCFARYAFTSPYFLVADSTRNCITGIVRPSFRWSARGDRVEKCKNVHFDAAVVIVCVWGVGEQGTTKCPSMPASLVGS